MRFLISILSLLLIVNYKPASCEDPSPCDYVKNGKVPHPKSCDKYYICTNYKGVEKNCSRTEHYSAKSKGCVPKHTFSCVVTTTHAPTTKGPTDARPILSNTKCVPDQKSLALVNKYEYFGTTYYASKAAYTSDTAAAAVCSSVCGYLAEVDTTSEEKTLMTILRSQSGTSGLLVGGTDKFEDKAWEFERSGKKLNFLNWCNGQPNINSVTREQCIAYYPEQCMHDISCNSIGFDYRYLCEVP